MATKYRADIDGLRAIAVTLVVLFHAGVPWLSGGFVGVDVFFVISGYLITDILWRELEAGTFSFARFYDRRARRILPALGVVLLATAVLGCIIFIPSELRELGLNVIASSLAASNLLALSRSGYFEGNTQDNPLLHTWSLGVEEQFYVIWPVLLFLCWRFLRRATWPLWVLTVASLALAEWSLARHSSGAFYLLPTRAWELSLGGIIALSPWMSLKRASVAALASLAALAGIVLSGSLYSASTPFPGLSAVLPCGAAALLIAAGRTPQAASRLLSAPPLVWLGKISYSFYLWHWPLLAFARVYANRPLTVAEALPLVLLAIALSAASLRWVEAPFRDARSPFVARIARPNAKLRGLPSSLPIAAAATTAVIAIGASFIVTNGLPGRVPVAVRALERSRLDTTRTVACHQMQRDPSIPDPQKCTFGPKGASSRGQVLLWGDSHADHFRPGVEQAALDKSFSVRQATKTTCPPLVSVAVINRSKEARDCAAFNDAVLELALHDAKIELVVLAARWAAYAEGRGAELDEAELFLTTRDSPRAGSRTESRRALELGLHETLRRLVAANKGVLIVGQAPEFGRDVPKCVSREAAAGRAFAACDMPRSEIEARARSTNELFARVKTEFPSVAVLLPAQELCSDRVCPAVGAGVVTMRDSNHLTRAASLRLVPGLLRLWPAR